MSPSDDSASTDHLRGAGASHNDRHDGHVLRPDLTAADAAALLRDSGEIVGIPVRGNSMEPLLGDGDTVRVLTGIDPRVGDVVVARAGDGVVVHRVMRVEADRVQLCGDNVPRADAWLDRYDVLGRVVAVDGVRHRRLDTSGARHLSRSLAGHSRIRDSMGGRPARPRAARLAKVHLTLANALVPQASLEDLVLLRLASPRGRTARVESWLSTISDDLDWDRVAERALLGQVGPQVYANVRRLPAPISPPERARERLRLQLNSNVARTRHIVEILDAILDRLDAVGVQALAHKGIALAACVYPDPSLRIMGDIDLSVRDKDRREAEHAARVIRSSLSRANPDRRSSSGFHVELDGTAHHDLDPALFGGGRWQSESFDWDAIWSHAQHKLVGGHTVLVPCPTDLLLTLIANSVRRGFTPVRLIVDIAHTIHSCQTDIDWAALQSELRRTRLDRRSWIALQLAATWCGAEVPLPLLEPPPGLRTAAYERLLLDWKRERPFARLPTRVLWAGSWHGAIWTAMSLVGRRIAHALRLPVVARTVVEMLDELRQEYRERSA